MNTSQNKIKISDLIANKTNNNFITKNKDLLLLLKEYDFNYIFNYNYLKYIYNINYNNE